MVTGKSPHVASSSQQRSFLPFVDETGVWGILQQEVPRQDFSPAPGHSRACDLEALPPGLPPCQHPSGRVPLQASEVPHPWNRQCRGAGWMQHGWGRSLLGLQGGPGLERGASVGRRSDGLAEGLDGSGRRGPGTQVPSTWPEAPGPPRAQLGLQVWGKSCRDEGPSGFSSTGGEASCGRALPVGPGSGGAAQAPQSSMVSAEMPAPACCLGR